MSEALTSATQAMDVAKLNKTHWRVWFLSAMGIFLDGFDLFIIAVALPLIAVQFDATPATLGLIGAAAPIGCILGATIFGRFTDKLGRKAILLIDLVFFVVFAGISALAWSVESLILFRFLLGIGIGADYPVSSTYITENMPAKLRGRMLVSGFGFQALGMLAGALVGGLILFIHPDVEAWRWMLGIAVFPAIIILLMRLTLPESPRWLIGQGRHEEASVVASKMTGKNIQADAIEVSSKSSFIDLFSSRYIRRTLLTSLSWFLMDVALYSIGSFTTIILAAMAFTDNTNFITKAASATHGSAFLDIFLVVGIIIAIFLVDSWGRIKLQAIGFLGMAVGLFILACTAMLPDNLRLTAIFIGFILFYLSTNAGPNPTTFLLPAEMFPTHLRATGHGFASASGKVGAAVGIFFLPVLMNSIGLNLTLAIIGVACLLGFILTVTLGQETKGTSLDALEERFEEDMNEAEIGLLVVQTDMQRLNSDIKRVEGALSKAIEEMRRLRQQSKSND